MLILLKKNQNNTRVICDHHFFHHLGRREMNKAQDTVSRADCAHHLLWGSAGMSGSTAACGSGGDRSGPHPTGKACFIPTGVLSKHMEPVSDLCWVPRGQR